ncbi:ATP-dependent zinc metalloprotease FtsH [Pseudomonas saliphila]|uniref:ATP-dependent zinc metalloprotease FtsH n=1 Tax=Pseudomonas saliphila TaxID=2586906 RepID=UPI0012390388|nr:ATP-dependent zinc metalloprotease FtsH [Pseudomonas saliphila]
MHKTHQWNLGYFFVAFVLLMAFQSWWGTQQTTVTLPYSEFLERLEQRTVTDLVIGQDDIQGRLVSSAGTHTRFVTQRVDTDLAELLARHEAEFRNRPSNTWLSNLLSWLFPLLLIIGFWAFMFRNIANRQGLGGMVNIGKSRARVYVERDTGVTFKDVAGIDEVKAELQEIVSFLKDQPRFGRLGARIPKGILLVGPPGTGKTLLARAVAGEAGVPFFSISGSEFVEMFVGVGAARVRDLFVQAREAAPCIIFIDELDSLGKMRGAGHFSGGNDEKEQTLNQLLAELDGFDPREGVVLLAATNRPEVLDPALMRAGRFDRQVVIDRPDRVGRAAIVQVHLKRVVCDPDIDPDKIAGLTTGFTGADLANLVNEAAIVATRRDADSVGMEDVTQAIERIVAGSERHGRLLQPHEREVVAYHELGHALVAAALPGMDPVHKVSIIPRSIGALGYTLQRSTEDRYLITAQELKNRLVVLLAGRAAEDLVFNEISTGAADDLARVTDIARQIVTRFGMCKEVGQAVFERQQSPFLGDMPGMMPARSYSEKTAEKIDLSINQLIDDAYQNARALLEQRRDVLDQGARLLLENETLTPEQFPPLIGEPAP